MDLMPEYAKTMTVTGLTMCGNAGALYYMQWAATPVYITMGFSALSIGLFCVGTAATIKQMYDYHTYQALPVEHEE